MAKDKILILQASANPNTGVWTLMRSLTEWLKSQPGLQVAVGIFTKKSWPYAHKVELEQMDIPCFFHPMYSFHGSYLLHYASRPLRRWVTCLYNVFKPCHIVVHLHRAWLSGIYLPIVAEIGCPVSVVSTFHGVRFYEKASQLKRLLHKLIAR
jgi:hypothetical protein